MKAPTTIQTRYTVNFCEPRRWEKVLSLERDMNHNTAMKGRRPNRDDEINNRPVNKNISHIRCSILDWNNALILSNPFSKWIGFNWNECWFIWSSQVSCPAVFKQRTLSNLADFIGSLETEMHHRSEWHQMMSKGRKSGWIHFKRENTPYFLGDCFHCELLGFYGITAWTGHFENINSPLFCLFEKGYENQTAMGFMTQSFSRIV